MFGRRKTESNPAQPEVGADEGADIHNDDEKSTGEVAVSIPGPRDISEVGPDDARIDLGSLQVSGVPGLSLQVTVDEKTKQVSMVTLVLEDAAVQVQVFAAPRSTGIWDDVRGQLMSSISAGGGLVEEAQGVFGTELRARVKAQNGQLQPARFVGVDGPRWFARGLFLGSAAAPEGHQALTDVFASLVIVRGDEAMAPGDPLPMVVPASDDSQVAAPQANP